MSYAYNPHTRYRQKAARRFSSFFWMVLFGILCASAGYGYGHWRALKKTSGLKQSVEVLTNERDSLRNGLTQMKAESGAAKMRYEQLQARYEKDFPTEGSLRELYDLIRTRLEEGGNASRLAFLIRSSRPPRDCEDAQNRRFVISTPAYNGPKSEVTVGNGAIAVSGSGASALSENGNPEAWYDPASPVSVQFVLGGSKTEEKRGVLPIHHTAVVDGREYRFTVSSGERSFARLSYDSCAYP